MLVTGTPVNLDTAKKVFLSGRGSKIHHKGIINTLFERKLQLTDEEFKAALMSDKNNWVLCAKKTRDRLETLLCREQLEDLMAIECSLDQYGN